MKDQVRILHININLDIDTQPQVMDRQIRLGNYTLTDTLDTDTAIWVIDQEIRSRNTLTDNFDTDTQPQVMDREIRSGNYTLTDSIADEPKHSEEVTVSWQVFKTLSVLFTIPVRHY